MAEVIVPRGLFQAILGAIVALRSLPPARCWRAFRAWLARLPEGDARRDADWRAGIFLGAALLKRSTVADNSTVASPLQPVTFWQ
jgi:hypothetical protein